MTTIGDRPEAFVPMSARTGRFHLNRPRSWTARRIRHCPTCDRRRRFVVALFIWYDAIWTCCGCGDAWSDGERMRRPFQRGWRDVVTRDARRRWALASSWATATSELAAAIRDEIES